MFVLHISAPIPSERYRSDTLGLTLQLSYTLAAFILYFWVISYLSWYNSLRKYFHYLNIIYNLYLKKTLFYNEFIMDISVVIHNQIITSLPILPHHHVPHPRSPSPPQALRRRRRRAHPGDPGEASRLREEDGQGRGHRRR